MPCNKPAPNNRVGVLWMGRFCGIRQQTPPPDLKRRQTRQCTRHIYCWNLSRLPFSRSTTSFLHRRRPPLRSPARTFIHTAPSPSRTSPALYPRPRHRQRLCRSPTTGQVKNWDFPPPAAGFATALLHPLRRDNGRAELQWRWWPAGGQVPR
jgi:hypothetical protein